MKRNKMFHFVMKLSFLLSRNKIIECNILVVFQLDSLDEM